jgi:hypothetical protein
MAGELADLQASCRDIGLQVGSAVEARHGTTHVAFALLLFHRGGGPLTVVSDAERADLEKALTDCAATLLAGLAPEEELV